VVPDRGVYASVDHHPPRSGENDHGTV